MPRLRRPRQARRGLTAAQMDDLGLALSPFRELSPLGGLPDDELRQLAERYHVDLEAAGWSDDGSGWWTYAVDVAGLPPIGGPSDDPEPLPD